MTLTEYMYAQVKGFWSYVLMKTILHNCVTFQNFNTILTSWTICFTTDYLPEEIENMEIEHKTCNIQLGVLYPLGA